MSKLHIFDVDGTILDSMKMWETLGSTYLKSKGCREFEKVDRIIASMTLDEAALYMKREYKLTEGPETIRREITAVIEDQYANVIRPFPETMELLHRIAKTGETMVILSISDRKCITLAMKRLGIYDYFSRIYTDTDFQISKRDPEIFRKVCELHHVIPAEAIVYDDADYAINAAKEAGCQVMAF